MKGEIEWERKFLLKSIPELKNFKKDEITQRYYSGPPKFRLRSINDEIFIANKKSNDIHPIEEEINISKELFYFLGGDLEENSVSKSRYYIPLEDGYVAELDIYKKNLLGLVTVEVEFETEEEMNSFIPPSWFGREVTYIKDYKNRSLAKKGIPKSIDSSELFYPIDLK